MMFRSAISLVLMMTAIPASADAPAQPREADAAFETMKNLVGTWRVADQPKSALRIQFSLTAGGTVLAESWNNRDRPHSLTVYHRDGTELIATHYCPQGNQPRLRKVSPKSNDSIEFAFRDATDLDAAESHLVALQFELMDAEKIVRHEVYRQNGIDTPSELLLVRDPESKAEQG